MRIIEIPVTDSTNSWLTTHAGELEAPVMVYALEQTAGRGQRGNSWESEPGKNLTASVLLKPENVLPAEQFAISEGVALAVVDTLRDFMIEARVKWPNDIYVGDYKICGILIEHSILGMSISRTIAGIGINVNQLQFLSDAPNPVSMAEVTGREYSLHEVAASLGRHLDERMRAVFSVDARDRERLHEAYMASLWRRVGLYPFMDKKRGDEIMARIVGVAPDGILTLETEDRERRSFAFKEVEWKR